MSSVPTAYAPPASIRSNIFKTLPDAIPPTEELEALHEELKQLKVRTLEKAKKAGDDMRLIEESMRRIKEREKGKAKAVEKVKKERDCECFLALDLLELIVIRLYSVTPFILPGCPKSNLDLFSRYQTPPGRRHLIFDVCDIVSSGALNFGHILTVVRSRVSRLHTPETSPTTALAGIKK